jgi:hypothetical protein
MFRNALAAVALMMAGATCAGTITIRNESDVAADCFWNRQGSTTIVQLARLMPGASTSFESADPVDLTCQRPIHPQNYSGLRPGAAYVVVKDGASAQPHLRETR